MKENETKQKIRQAFLKKRDMLPVDIKKEKDDLIKKHIIKQPEFIKAKTVLFYASFRSEVDTKKIMDISLKTGKTVILPKVENKEKVLKLYEIKGINELSPGYMQIMEPKASEERLKSLADIDLILIPGAAFDLQGNRLGYGAGFYDKLLSGMKKRILIIAPAYEEQVAEKIAAEPHDIKVDRIITDKRIINCSNFSAVIFHFDTNFRQMLNF